MEQQLGRENGIFIQAEDEIAAIGLAIGASLAGAKAMTATSGPGLDLMTEMIGLASAAEIPVVIVDVQRCGPATGIPSKLEQSDLNHAVYGGHGDAPRVVLASHDVESCYRLLIEAVNIAEYFQTPVILLSDQWLGQTTVATDGTFLSRHYPLIQRKKPGKDEYAKEYQRYQMTEDLISPMTSFGDEGFVYQTTGLTHNEKGVPTFSAAVHQRMHEKRWNKLVPLRHRRDLIRVLGNERASRGIITWGSSAQFVVEAINCLGFQQGIKICIPELIYPLPDEIAAFSSSLEKLLVVELNHSGQFYRYLRSQIDLPAKVEVYARAGGAPFTLKELTEPITQLIK
jgi:2-oxoglutarate ferredoxin oxidoreductase subunit alpha